MATQKMREKRRPAPTEQFNQGYTLVLQQVSRSASQQSPPLSSSSSPSSSILSINTTYQISIHHTIRIIIIIPNLKSPPHPPTKINWIDPPMANAAAYNSSGLPLHLCVFLLILFGFVGITWYITYESLLEAILDQFKLLLMLSPLLLLLAIHLFDSMTSLFFIPLPDKDSFHAAGGTPWGLALLLVLLFFMISYQSDFRDRWFPLLS